MPLSGGGHTKAANDADKASPAASQVKLRDKLRDEPTKQAIRETRDRTRDDRETEHDCGEVMSDSNSAPLLVSMPCGGVSAQVF